LGRQGGIWDEIPYAILRHEKSAGERVGFLLRWWPVKSPFLPVEYEVTQLVSHVETTTLRTLQCAQENEWGAISPKRKGIYIRKFRG
jgi:hypothetical protein